MAGSLGAASSTPTGATAMPMVTPKKRRVEVKGEDDGDTAMSHGSCELLEVDTNLGEEQVFECNGCFRSNRDNSFTVIGGEVQF